MNLEQLRKKLASHLNDFILEHPELETWANEALKLVLKTAKKDKGASRSMVEVPAKALDDFVNGLTGSNNIGSQTAKKLKRLDSLFARWHADDLVYIPCPVPVAEIKRDYCASYDDGDELLIASFDGLWEFFLYRDLRPETGQATILKKNGMSEEDNRSCCALFALLGAGDLLVQSPAYALADLSVENMNFDETWTISGWYLKSSYRWPISWISAIYLMRLLALIPKRFRTDSFFFGRRYFEEAYDQEADRLIRKPVRKRGGAIILHDVFSRWLRWLTRLARDAGADIPSDLSLKTAIKAARIRAAMVFAPAVVAYLSGKLPSPPLDDYSWRSIQTGTIEEVGGQSMQMPRKKNGLASVVKPAADLRTPEREQAEKYFRHAELILIDGQAHRISKQQVAKSIIQIAEKLPRVPKDDGNQAFMGNVRAALLYVAYRASQLKTRLETLLTELNWLREVIPHLLGKISLPSLSADELTDLASGYVRSFKSPSTQKQRRASLKRFLSFVQKNSERVLEKGLEMFEPNWNSPDISITWYRKPRRVLTRQHIDELINDGDSNEHDLYPKLFSCLGFYCGMREGEMLALSNRDISHGLTDDLELSYSKTEAGIRRLPVSILIPEPYRKLLVSYLRQMDGGRKSKPLIEDGPKSLQKFERQLARKFGASSHTLRHSAASMMVMKLCLAQNLVSGEPVSLGLEQLRKHLRQTQSEEFSKNAIVAFADELLGPGWRKSWPMTIPVVSKLLGHLEPSVTVQVYLHIIELIAAHTRDLIQWPPMTQIQAAAMSKTSRTTLIKHLGLSDGELYTAEEIAVYMATRYLPNELFEM